YLLSGLKQVSFKHNKSPNFRTILDLQVFTDSISHAKLLFDYSAHSAHQDALAITPPLARWLTLSPNNSITFWQIPSSTKWSIHHKAHTLAKLLKLPIQHNTPVQASLNYYHKGITKYLTYLWQNALFIANDEYRGHTFLNLMSGDRDILPTYTNGGGWLPHVGADTKLCACLTSDFSQANMKLPANVDMYWRQGTTFLMNALYMRANGPTKKEPHVIIQTGNGSIPLNNEQTGALIVVKTGRMGCTVAPQLWW
ncbi:hypothetical protein P691DRAFT_785828, partial [Macrolepiota fuliginosa MF-IS2]